MPSLGPRHMPMHAIFIMKQRGKRQMKCARGGDFSPALYLGLKQRVRLPLFKFCLCVLFSRYFT